MSKIFHSVTTTRRHREHGYCEDTDFGVIELRVLDKSKKILVVSFNDYNERKEFISFNEMVYQKINNSSYLGGFSQEDETEILKKQGYFSEKSAKELVLRVRQNAERSTSGISDFRFILIGKTLYVELCELGDLQISVTGNMMFANWISIDIEPKYENKSLYPLNKKNFNKVVKIELARWNKGNPKTTNINGRTHSSFSKPTKVKWGEFYKI